MNIRNVVDQDVGHFSTAIEKMNQSGHVQTQLTKGSPFFFEGISENQHPRISKIKEFISDNKVVVGIGSIGLVVALILGIRHLF